MAVMAVSVWHRGQWKALTPLLASSRDPRLGGSCNGYIVANMAWGAMPAVRICGRANFQVTYFILMDVDSWRTVFIMVDMDVMHAPRWVTLYVVSYGVPTLLLSREAYVRIAWPQAGIKENPVTAAFFILVHNFVAGRPSWREA